MILILGMITYTTQLMGDTEELRSLLQMEQFVFNIASREQFPEKKNSLVVLHSKVYKNVRKSNPEIPAQVIIRAEQDVLGAYRAVKSNKHKLNRPIEKSRLSMRLDKHLYSIPDESSIRISTTKGYKRQTYKLLIYPRLKELMEKYHYRDPLIYENEGKMFIALSFENKPSEKMKQRIALGVDLGIRRSAAMSDGRIIIDRKFNGEKRRLRHLKDALKSRGTKSARRKLRSTLRRKERNKNRNQTHLIANMILDTKSDTIVLENLKSIKRKKHKHQNKRSISQVPLFDLRRVITYKAENQGKTVLLVCPSYTSQRDSVSGKIEGERRGCRFYSATNGLVYDADINAAINIAKMSKLPISQTTNLTYGQALINVPNVCKSSSGGGVLQTSKL
jgi:IS605 OrfB family transposase